MKTAGTGFDFGLNWENYSSNSLDAGKAAQARSSLLSLLGAADFNDMAFLDIGYGQGLALLSAAESAGRAVGLEINQRGPGILEKNRGFFRLKTVPILFEGSILDDAVVKRLKEHSGSGQGYDVVYSWGVLHHTGDMHKAMQNACCLVKPGGLLALAIYNRHWSSPFWKAVKRTYCSSPSLIRKAIVFLFVPLIWLAKFIVTGKDPCKKERGMDFYYDCIDWIGGYPYEYASQEEVRKFLQEQGFAVLKNNPPAVPTGCNEFLFCKKRS